MIRASIDIGSNSVLLLAAKLDKEGKYIEEELLSMSYITALGKSLDKTKKFDQESMDQTFEALIDYKNKLSSFLIKPEDVLVTATEAARVATNSADFFLEIKNKLGFKVLIITSEAEAFFTAFGVASQSKNTESKTSAIIMDIGGASTELIKVEFNPFSIVKSISLPIGAVRANDWLANKTFDEKSIKIFEEDLSFYQTKTLLCVAGGMTSMAAMYLGLKEFDSRKIDGLSISFNEFLNFNETIQKMSKEQILLKYPFLGKRAEVIRAATHLALLFGGTLKVEEIKVSTRGLRYGTLIAGKINDKFIGH